jgi:hypothetical protein
MFTVDSLRERGRVSVIIPYNSKVAMLPGPSTACPDAPDCGAKERVGSLRPAGHSGENYR